MSGRNWHADLPWNTLKKWYALGRRRWFDAPRPEGTYYRVEGSMLAEGSDTALERNLNRIEMGLGGLSYAPNWELSYYKRGEILNMARVVHARDPEYPDIEWWQDHVRGWPVPDQPGAIDLGAHWEAEPTQSPIKHLENAGLSVGIGMDRLAEHLEDVGIRYTEVEWPDD